MSKTTSSQRPLLRMKKNGKTWTIQQKGKKPEDLTDEEYRTAFNELYLQDLQGNLQIEQAVYDWMKVQNPNQP